MVSSVLVSLCLGSTQFLKLQGLENIFLGKKQFFCILRGLYQQIETFFTQIAVWCLFFFLKKETFTNHHRRQFVTAFGKNLFLKGI